MNAYAIVDDSGNLHWQYADSPVQAARQYEADLLGDIGNMPWRAEIRHEDGIWIASRESGGELQVVDQLNGLVVQEVSNA